MVSLFARSQPLNGLVIHRIDRKVKSADPFYCYNLAGQKQSRCLGNNLLNLSRDCLAFAVRQPDFRPTCGTSNRLSVEATVGDVRVLSSAFVAHPKNRHRGIRPVVGNVPDDGISRPAIGAVYEGIPVPKILSISHFRQAIPAGRNVGGNLRQQRPLRIARPDEKPVFGLDERYIHCTAGFYFGQRRFVGVRLEPDEEFGNLFFFAL
jgi:hypothetical protein